MIQDHSNENKNINHTQGSFNSNSNEKPTQLFLEELRERTSTPYTVFTTKMSPF